MRIRCKNAILTDALGVRTGDLVLEAGRISNDHESPCQQTLDLAGYTVLPAFTDLHCHLRDPGYPQKETMETGMRAAQKGGYTTLCAMANTDPVCSTPERVTQNHERAAKLDLCDLVQAAAAGEALCDEKPTDWAALSRVTNVLSNDGKTIFSDDFMRQLLIASKRYGFLISTHCQPERAIVRRDIDLMRTVGGNLHVGHISRKETVDMIRAAKAEGLSLTCEVTPHHLFGWDDPYRVNPPLRTHDDVLALIEGIKDGTIDCIATDHAPHTPEDKAQGMAGISGIENAFSIVWKVFTENGLPMTKLSEMMAKRPREILKKGVALLQPGEKADLVVVDPAAEDVICREKMISRSNNTPFDGRSVRGKIHMTIRGGRICYDDGSIGAGGQ